MEHKPGYRLYQQLPQIYRDEDSKIGYPLLRFLELIDEGGVSVLEEYIQNHYKLTDIDQTPEEFIDVIADTIGLEFLFDTTPSQKRNLIKMAREIYERKGTVRGIELFVEYVTGYQDVSITNENPEDRSFDIKIGIPDENPVKSEVFIPQLHRVLRMYAPFPSIVTIVLSFFYFDIINGNLTDEHPIDAVGDVKEDVVMDVFDTYPTTHITGRNLLDSAEGQITKGASLTGFRTNRVGRFKTNQFDNIDVLYYNSGIRVAYS